MLKQATKDKKLNVDSIVANIYENASQNQLGIDGEELDQEELEIIRLMTIPNFEWKKTKGDFDNYEFNFSVDDMFESFTESHLLQIWDEWWKRNPRFERKKKMMNPGVE